MELLVKRLSVSPRLGSKNSVMKSEAVANSVSQFIYDSENGIIFEASFKRYEDLCINDCKNWDEGSKLRLGVSDHCNYVLLKKPADFKFADTVESHMHVRKKVVHVSYPIQLTPTG